MKRQISAFLIAALVAVPAVTMAADDDTFTGSFNYGPPVADTENQWRQTAITFSDARLDGKVTLTAQSDQLDEEGIYMYSFRIETEDGAWQGRPVPGFWTDEDGYATSVHLLTGSGEYEGLSAVVEVSLSRGGNWSMRGRIIDVPFPEL